MIDLNQEIPNENLTQKDIMQFLLHSTQHVATREELQDVKKELKEDINKLDEKVDKVEANLNTKIDKVEANLKQDINKLDEKIDKVNFKFDKLQWLIIATMMTVLFKDYTLTFFHTIK